MKMEIKSSPSCSSSPTHNSNSNGEVSAAALLILSEEQREAARKHNIDLRLKIFRDIRRPGRDYSQLLDNLGLVKGDHDMKSDFVEMCIGESRRFRRHRMVGSIQECCSRISPSRPSSSTTRGSRRYQELTLALLELLSPSGIRLGLGVVEGVAMAMGEAVGRHQSVMSSKATTTRKT
ncbi:GL14167 [Drosophila persimilis]|uniref:GL14167 n=1 Tax=Drosophila persimilis TaxID=7234 RepID=B4GU17_DROPE|nr:GL14167 [Drosophila persimilis]